MHSSNMPWPEILTALLAIAAIVGSYFAAKNGFTKRSMELKNDLISTQDKTIKEIRDQNSKQQGMINQLRQEVDTWKREPIKQLSDDYHQLAGAVRQMTELLQAIVHPMVTETTTIKKEGVPGYDR